MEAGAEDRLLKLPWVANNLRWVMWKLVSLASVHKDKQEDLLSWAAVLDEMKKR